MLGNSPDCPTQVSKHGTRVSKCWETSRGQGPRFLPFTEGMLPVKIIEGIDMFIILKWIYIGKYYQLKVILTNNKLFLIFESYLAFLGVIVR